MVQAAENVKEKVQVTEDRIIKVKPKIRKRPFYKEGHDGEFMFTGCFRDYGLPYDSKRRSYVNPFKAKEEQAVFEELLNQEEGALNLYNFKSEFWGRKFKMSITKDGMELNLNNPVDALWYRVFLVDPKFADGEENSNPETQYVLIDELVAQEEDNKVALRKSKAFGELSKLKKSRAKMVDVLRLLGKKPSENSSSEWLEAELIKIIEQVEDLKGITGVDKFLQVVEDPKSSDKIFIMDAIELGEIKSDRAGYRLVETDKYLGKTMIDVIDYFASGDPDAKEQKLIIKERINKK